MIGALNFLGNMKTVDNLNIEHARQILDADHYAIEKSQREDFGISSCETT